MFSAVFSFYYMFSFVSSSYSFPKPLSPEDEKTCLEKYENGTEPEKEDARKTLIERNLRLVAHIAKKYSGFQGENDDLISIGTIGLIKAISSYDSKKCIRLATYASRCIENAILTYRLKRTVSPQIFFKYSSSKNTCGHLGQAASRFSIVGQIWE